MYIGIGGLIVLLIILFLVFGRGRWTRQSRSPDQRPSEGRAQCGRRRTEELRGLGERVGGAVKRSGTPEVSSSARAGESTLSDRPVNGEAAGSANGSGGLVDARGQDV